MLQALQARSEKRLLASPPDAASPPAGSRTMDQYTTGSTGTVQGPKPDAALGETPAQRNLRLEPPVAQAQQSRPASGSISPSALSVRSS